MLISMGQLKNNVKIFSISSFKSAFFKTTKQQINIDKEKQYLSGYGLVCGGMPGGSGRTHLL